MISIERPIAAYPAEDPAAAGQDAFHVSEIIAPEVPTETSAQELLIAATGIRDVIEAAWRVKFVDTNEMTEADLRAKVLSPTDQLQHLLHPENEGRYLVAVAGQFAPITAYTDPAAVQAVLRIETYTPRSAWKRPYPNVTDLETRDGHVAPDSAFGRQAAVLLYHGLELYLPPRRVSAYACEPEQTLATTEEELEFYRRLGFREENVTPPERIGSYLMRYTHLEGKPNVLLQHALRQHYPFLRPGGISARLDT